MMNLPQLRSKRGADAGNEIHTTQGTAIINQIHVRNQVRTGVDERICSEVMI